MHRTLFITIYSVLLVARSSSAVTITGSDWNVYFNLPDQSISTNSATPDEYAIRDAFVARINALQSNQWAALSTYTFSVSNVVTGGAGPIVNAMSAALDRGAKVSFIADNGIDTVTQFGGSNSLSSLAARPTNPLTLSQCATSSGIMHDKLGLFDYGPSNRWIMVASWNFTAGASSQQWNIGLEIRNEQMFAAYTNEAAQFLAGHFHGDPLKSHLHDGSTFLLTGAWTNGWVRFCPCTNATDGGNNAQRDITNRIAHAQQEIVFALNDLTLNLVATQLVTAVNRGVMVGGVMPKSDITGVSASTYSFLTNSANYSTTNRVNFWTAFSRADGSTTDSNQLDLVHCKWMAIDPFGPNPWLIHGSANWSVSALLTTTTSGNDENIAFIPHRDIARIFYSHFKRITGAFQSRSDFWLDSNTNGFGLWLTDTNAYSIEHTFAATGVWNPAAPASNFIGRIAITNAAATNEFFRARRN